MSFKDIIQQDLSTFVNNSEFAEFHDVNGQQLSVVIDKDGLKGRPRQPADLYNSAAGIYLGNVMLYVREMDMEDRPVVDQHLRLDGKLYRVTSCDVDMGMIEIGLEANEA
jgi:hypothetical protein